MHGALRGRRAAAPPKALQRPELDAAGVLEWVKDRRVVLDDRNGFVLTAAEDHDFDEFAARLLKLLVP
jgi:hypothetical protein